MRLWSHTRSSELLSDGHELDLLHAVSPALVALNELNNESLAERCRAVILGGEELNELGDLALGHPLGPGWVSEADLLKSLLCGVSHCLAVGLSCDGWLSLLGHELLSLGIKLLLPLSGALRVDLGIWVVSEDSLWLNRWLSAHGLSDMELVGQILLLVWINDL